MKLKAKPYLWLGRWMKEEELYTVETQLLYKHKWLGSNPRYFRRGRDTDAFSIFTYITGTNNV